MVMGVAHAVKEHVGMGLALGNERGGYAGFQAQGGMFHPCLVPKVAVNKGLKREAAALNEQ